MGVVGPFGGVGVVGYTPAVSFGGASRFFPAGYRGGVYGGGVARRGFYRGGRRYLREVDERSFPLATSPALAPFPALAPSPAAEDDADDACRTMWEVIASRGDLSYLRRLLERDLPEVAATLDARNASEVVARRPDEPPPDGYTYDRDDPGVVPLRNPNTGGYYVDTLFAPTDDAVRALDRYLRQTGETHTEARNPPANANATDADALRMLGAGNVTAAANLVAYYVIPDRRLRMPDLEVDELLTTALGGGARLLFERVPDDHDDGYDDGDGGDAAIRGAGSRAGVVGGAIDACNGAVFVVDRVLLPMDADGVLDERQTAHAKMIREAMDREEESRTRD